MITLLVLIVIVAIFLIISIMVQNPKGGGLDSSFGGGGQMIGGVKQTGDFLEKSTWVLSIILVMLVLGVNVAINKKASADFKATNAKIVQPTSAPTENPNDKPIDK